MGKSETLQSLAEDFARRGDHPAILACRDEAPESWSYARLGDAITRLATGLVRAGVARGEPVALIAPNLPEWIVSYFAIVSAGALAVPIDELSGDAELALVIADCGCRRVFTTRAHAARLAALEGGAALDIHLLDDDADAASWRGLLAEAGGALPRVAPDAYASLLYTSGTTGTPKAVPLSHHNITANLAALLATPLATAADRVLLPLPLHHVYPFTGGMLVAFASGATLVFPAGLSGPEMARALRTAKVTVMIGVPRLYDALLAGIEATAAARGGLAAKLFPRLVALSGWARHRLHLPAGRLLFRRLHAEIGPELRLLASGGARLDPATSRKLEALGWQVASGYGLTETAPVLAFNPPGRGRPGSAGLPVPGVALRLEPVAGHEHGEILARGPNVFDGYWKNPEATAAAFTADGWFRTGDLGYRDADGYLYVTGRVKEVIVLPGGKNVYPEDLETAYVANPLIAEVAIIPRDFGIAALIVPDDETIRAKGSARAMGFLREEIQALALDLAPHQRVSAYAVTREKLPRTQLGKLRRHLLAEIYARAEAGVGPPPAPPSEADRALLAEPIAQTVWRWLAARFPDRDLSLDTSPQLDLGVDSLEWLNLGLDLEARTGVRLEEEALARVVTLRDLLEKAIAAAESAAPRAPLTLSPEQQRWLAPTGPALFVLGLVIYAVVAIAMRVGFRLGVKGKERLPPGGPLVLAPNHASYLDPFALAAALGWRRLRDTYWAGWTGRMFTGPLPRLLSRTARVVPIDPDRGPAAGLAFGTQVLARGHGLVWFPEGRRSRDGTLHEFHPGVGLLLAESGAPVVPVRITGSFAALPVGRYFPRLARIHVSFGEALAPDALAAAVEGASRPARIAAALRDAVAALEPASAPRGHS